MDLTDLFIHRIVLSCVISILVLVFELRAEQSSVATLREAGWLQQDIAQ